MHLYKKILKNRIPYIGSHPIAGSERKGMDAAYSNLFEDAVCVLTPDLNTSSKTLKKVMIFWKTVKALPVIKSSEIHDKIFAYISHLPHLISFVMVHAVSDKAYLRIAGEAWRDMTRIAHSSPELWTEIFMQNRYYLMKSLKKFMTELKTVEKHLIHSNPSILKKYLDETRLLLRNGKKNKWKAAAP
jgi:prephenate dehydrogenase